jgi:nucleoside-diphosphate-sugar epimerase
MNILITGANGFIGAYLSKALIKNNLNVIQVVRKNQSTKKNANIIIKEINIKTDWNDSLKGIDVVIHLAGRAHVLKEKAIDPYQAFTSINVDATKSLAIQAAANGVKRFIFVSSVGVNGNKTIAPFTELQPPNPQELYAISKKNAEDSLWEISHKTGLEVVVIRPPLVYGSGAKGNFEKLVKLCNYKIPLPFGAVHNKRSFIYVENLIDFIVNCIDHPLAANETFLISDDEDISTTELIKYIQHAMGQKSILIPVPKDLLSSLFKLMGKSALYNKLCGNLEMDITKAKELLNWKPPYTLKEGVNITVRKNN